MFRTLWISQSRHALLFGFCLLLATSVQAIPPTISIQGSLTGTDGKALTGVRVWRVQFYDAETEGNKLGDALAGSLQVGSLGHFSITPTPPDAVLAASGEVWYEMAIDSAATPDATIDPSDIFPKRVAVHSVLFAQRAAQALAAQTAAQADRATTASVALKAGQATRALHAETATTATVAIRAKTLDGVPIQVLVTQDELTSALAAKAALAHSHNLDTLAGSVTDAQVPDSITVNHAATATTATLATNATHAQAANIATTATVALKALQADLSTTASHAVTATTSTVALKALEADHATTATVALNARTLGGVAVSALTTDAELTSALAAKAALAHSHNLDALAGAVTDAQVPDSITVNHAATATTATLAVNAAHAQTADRATTATFAGNASHANHALTADTATTATNAGTVGGIPAVQLATNAELTSALAEKAALVHSHNLDALAGTVTDAQVPDSITVNHAATATTATLATNAVHAAAADTATTASFALNATNASTAAHAQTTD